MLDIDNRQIMSGSLNRSFNNMIISVRKYKLKKYY